MKITTTSRSELNVKLGLKENWLQFTLLVIVNAFVGGMVGLERSILPKLAAEEFAITGATAVLSFIVVFGFVKATSNYYAGRLAGTLGRKNTLILGWIFGLPIPFILIWTSSWNWVVFANILLGINQGLAWSSTVVMKIDLVGEKQRGFAMGINEFAGYLSIAVVAYVTASIADTYGVRPYPFYIGIGLAVLGFLVTVLFVRDTLNHLDTEASNSSLKRLKNPFLQVSLTDRNLGAITQAGLINNLNDGMVWGILPILLISRGYSMTEIGIIVGTYPAVWGVGQIATGKIADHFNKKKMLSTGMFLQAIALLLFLWADSFVMFITLAIILGLGTAIVYPTFLATIAELLHPGDRANGIGIFRLWRDSGYAIGAFLTGLLADSFGYNAAIATIATLTFLSALFLTTRMRLK